MGGLLFVLIYLSSLLLVVWWMARVLTLLQSIAASLGEIADRQDNVPGV